MHMIELVKGHRYWLAKERAFVTFERMDNGWAVVFDEQNETYYVYPEDLEPVS